MAVTHESFGAVLRLGNFLYKYAVSTKLKLVYQVDTVYPDSYYLWKYLKYPPLVEPELVLNPTIKPRVWEWTPQEDEWFFNHDWNIDQVISLDFFFQSVKWFEDYEAEVKQALTFTDESIDAVKNKYQKLFEKPFILLSIRLGDFVNHGEFYQIPVAWYKKTLQNFDLNNWNVLVTSDDINQAKVFFGNSFYYAEANNTHTHKEQFKYYHGDASEHLILGSLSDAQIISNSTFSWWQAYLAQGDTYHCGKVFSEYGNFKNIDTSNYYHHNWIKA